MNRSWDPLDWPGPYIRKHRTKLPSNLISSDMFILQIYNLNVQYNIEDLLLLDAPVITIKYSNNIALTGGFLGIILVLCTLYVHLVDHLSLGFG